MTGGFWMGVALIVILAATLVAALRTGRGDPDLEWRGKDLRDLETGDHRKPRRAWWRRPLGRR